MTVKRMGGDIDLRRNPPRLQGVTGAPLRILGMWKAKVGVGDHKICEVFSSSTKFLPLVRRTLGM